jgi:hypothetical protein
MMVLEVAGKNDLIFFLYISNKKLIKIIQSFAITLEFTTIQSK